MARRTDPTLMTEREAAEYLTLSESSLQKDRWKRHLGIPFVKLGGAVRYRRGDLDQWLLGRVVKEA